MYLDGKTYYSFCYGTYSTLGLVEAALKHSITTVALCNINCTYNHWEFVKLCREAGIKPVTCIYESPVVPFHEQKSISTENTFHAETTNLNFFRSELVRKTEKIAFQLRCDNRLTG